MRRIVYIAAAVERASFSLAKEEGRKGRANKPKGKGDG